jgi:uncharacterized phiE125 gp8 family phage protein
MAGLKVITPPAFEPVTVEELLTQLREDDPSDELINTLTSLITAAREWCEGYQNRSYVAQTLELALDQWPNKPIDLPRPPLQSVLSVTYTDQDGETTTWPSSNYLVDDFAYVATLIKKRSVNWPCASLIDINGIKIRYVAGYAPSIDDISLVPERVKQAIILLAMTWYDTPGCPPPDAVESLLYLDRVMPV